MSATVLKPPLVSSQTAPEFKVIELLKLIVLAVLLLDPKLILPVIFVAPRIVVLRLMVIFPPLLTINAPKVIVPPFKLSNAPVFKVTEPTEVWVTEPVMFTAPVPVVAMITVSPVAGTTPPIQVEAVDHVPPVVVLVIVAACIPKLEKSKNNTKTNFVQRVLNVDSFSNFRKVIVFFMALFKFLKKFR